MRKFDTILWDVDQTLLDFKKSEDYAVRFCFRKYGKEAADETDNAGPAAETGTEKDDQAEDSSR